jgi:hypothetical protein
MFLHNFLAMTSSTTNGTAVRYKNIFKQNVFGVCSPVISIYLSSDILPRINSGGILLGCVQLSTVLRFSDTMPTREVGHGHGPCHPATTPPDRRYLECPFEDIERTIHVCLHFPATGAGIKATMLPVGSKDLTATMASS